MISKRVIWIAGMMAASLQPFAFAGVTSVYGVAPRAESMQAFTAVADDPSAIFYNPAGITQVSGTQLDQGISLIVPHSRYINSTNGSRSYMDKVSLGADLFLTSDHYKPWFVGMGLYAPNARFANYDETLAVYNQTHSSKFLRLDLAPTVGYRLNDHWSFGLSLVGSRVSVSSDIFDLDLHGLGYGATAQAGVLWHFAPAWRYGLDIRGPMTVRISGNAGVTGLGDAGFVTRIPFPMVISNGLAWQMSNKWLLSLSYEYELWSTLKNVVRDYNNAVFNTPTLSTNIVNARDVGDVRVGLDYRMNPNQEFEFGYSYLPIATSETYVVPAKPDFNTHLFSAGYSQYMGPYRVDIGYEFAYMPEFTSDSTAYPGQYRMTAHTFMLGLGMNLG